VRSNLFIIVKHFKPALLVLFIVLAGAQTPGAEGYGVAQTAPARRAELETSAAAKRALADLGSKDLRRAKDARLRTASLRAVAALKAIADNTSKAREAALVANLDRAILTLKALPQPPSMSMQACDSSYKTCMELCKETGGDCKLCGIGQNGCYLNELAAAIAHEHDPSKN
jgi:hypothetical protein